MLVVAAVRLRECGVRVSNGLVGRSNRSCLVRALGLPRCCNGGLSTLCSYLYRVRYRVRLVGSSSISGSVVSAFGSTSVRGSFLGFRVLC